MRSHGPVASCFCLLLVFADQAQVIVIRLQIHKRSVASKMQFRIIARSLTILTNSMILILTTSEVAPPAEFVSERLVYLSLFQRQPCMERNMSAFSCCTNLNGSCQRTAVGGLWTVPRLICISGCHREVGSCHKVEVPISHSAARFSCRHRGSCQRRTGFCQTRWGSTGGCRFRAAPCLLWGRAWAAIDGDWLRLRWRCGL